MQDHVRLAMWQRVFPTDAAPVHVQVEVTWRCNWRCVHCYQDTHAAAGPSTAQLLRLCEELAANGTMHLIVTGGEPLMRRDLLEVLTAARGHGVGLTLYTNGHLIKPELARRLGRLIAAAELSVLAGDDTVHDDLAQARGAARHTWRAVHLLREQGVTVTVKTPLLRPAISTFGALARRCTAAGVTWHPDTEISTSYDGAHYPLQHQLTPAELARFYAEFPGFDPRSGYTTDPGVSNGICLAGRRFCFIDVHGDVYPCLSFKAASDHLTRAGTPSPVAMGNVFTQPFGEIWESGIGQFIRARDGRDFHRCQGCTGQCSPCMAHNFEATGELFEMAGSCVRLPTNAIPVRSGPTATPVPLGMPVARPVS